MPTSAKPSLKDFSRRLLGHEAISRKPADAKESAVFRVCEKLRGPLGRFMGLGGFRSLLARALALASAEFPSLSMLRIKADGSLEGLDELEAKLDSPAFVDGEVVLVSQLLSLLVTFIGSALTLRLLHDIWPNLDDMNF